MATITTSRPFLDYEEDDHRAAVMIVTLVCLLLTIGTLTAKIVVSQGIRNMTVATDTVLYVGAILMLGQGSCIAYASVLGLGRHRSDDRSNELRILMLEYTASLLAIVALACTKVSLCILMRQINNHGRVRTGTQVLIGVVTVTSGTGLLGTAFRCTLPTPWRAASDRICPSAEALYLYNGIVNMATDLLLCMLAVAMVWDVKTDNKNKFTVVALFACRIVCPVCAIPSLMSTGFLYEDGDFTWLAVAPTLWLQVSYNLSVITSCIPTIKPVLDSLSGTLKGITVIDAPYNLTALPGKSGFKLTALQTETNSSRGLSFISRPSGSQGRVRWSRDVRGNQASCYTTAERKSAEMAKDMSETRSESLRNLTEGAVTVVEEVDVDYESIDRRDSATEGRKQHVEGL